MIELDPKVVTVRQLLSCQGTIDIRIVGTVVFDTDGARIENRFTWGGPYWTITRVAFSHSCVEHDPKIRYEGAAVPTRDVFRVHARAKTTSGAPDESLGTFHLDHGFLLYQPEDPT